MKVLGASALDEEQEQGAGGEVNAGTKVWRDLVKAALLGTERKPFATPRTDTPLDDLLSVGAEDEGALLSAAGVLALYNKAGKLAPLDVRPALAPAEAEDRPVCSDEAAVYLARVLRDTPHEHLSEWLSLCVAAQRRAPVEYLADLLDARRDKINENDDLRLAIGQRGAWLAAHNPDWRYATTGAEDEAWQDGAWSDRLNIFIRRRNSDPAQAREMLAEALEGESPDHRAVLLTRLRANLSMDDEDFLEQRLEDRSAEVRSRVAYLLGKLPESRFVARMIARADALLNLKVETKTALGIKLSSKIALEVTLPDKPNKAAIRDGVEKQTKPSRFLELVIQAIPPRHWTALASSPAALIAAAQQTEWAEAIIRAWLVATARYEDSAWIDAFLATPELRAVSAEHLAHHIAEPRREALALEIMKSAPVKLLEDSELRSFLTAFDAWSMTLSREVLRQLLALAAGSNKNKFWYIDALLKEYANRMDPALESEFNTAPLRGKADPTALEKIEAMRDILSFRKGMIAAFRR